MNTDQQMDNSSRGEETMLSKQNRQAQNTALLNRGVRWLIAGIVILLSSFAVTFLLFQADMSITTAMYTLNICGGICIFKGMMDILGF